MPFINTNKIESINRKRRKNDLKRRANERIGNWKVTPSGMSAGTVSISSSSGGEKIKVSSKLIKTTIKLNEGLDATETEINITVGGSTQFKIHDLIRIDSEDMIITGKASADAINVKRGANHTAAVTHGNNSQFIYKYNPVNPTRYSELSSETLSFTKDGSTFNYPKQLQFIPASALTFGSAFTFASANLIDYDNNEYDVLFTLRNMQVFNVADVAANQSVQFSAESKSSTGFTPTANIYVGDTLNTTTVTSFDRAGASFGGTRSVPSNSTDIISTDAFDDAAQSTTDSDAVVSCSVTFTITYSAMKGDGFVETIGYLRAGTASSDAFASSRYQSTYFEDFRDSESGDGTSVKNISFDFGGDLGDPARVVLSVTDYIQSGGSTATMLIALNSISYVNLDGTTRSITGNNKADAIVIAR